MARPPSPRPGGEVKPASQGDLATGQTGGPRWHVVPTSALVLETSRRHWSASPYGPINAPKRESAPPIHARLGQKPLHAAQLLQQLDATPLQAQRLLGIRSDLRVVLGKAARLRQRLQRLVDAVRKPSAAGQVAVTMRNGGWAFTLVSARAAGPIPSSSSGVASPG